MKKSPYPARVWVLGAFALLLALAAVFYNIAGDDVAEGGGPCFGLGTMMFVALLIGTSLPIHKKPPSRSSANSQPASS